jgi:hypothetical protein
MEGKTSSNVFRTEKRKENTDCIGLDSVLKTKQMTNYGSNIP